MGRPWGRNLGELSFWSSTTTVTHTSSRVTSPPSPAATTLLEPSPPSVSEIKFVRLVQFEETESLKYQDNVMVLGESIPGELISNIFALQSSLPMDLTSSKVTNPNKYYLNLTFPYPLN